MIKCLWLLIIGCFLGGCSDRESLANNQRPDNLEQQLKIVLQPLEKFDFAPDSVADLSNVQSPFSVRKGGDKNVLSIATLLGADWRLAGEVRENSELMGVFLVSQNKSLYFGVGLSVANSRWRVINITQDSVVFENPQLTRYWALPYRSDQVLVVKNKVGVK